jgi:hypothetical protein
MKPQTPSRSVSTEADFEALSWHDVHVHALALGDWQESGRAYVDLDYIIEWLRPDTDKDPWKFKIAPATLVFQGVAKIVIHLDWGAGITLTEIKRDEVQLEGGWKGYRWSLRSDEGSLEIWAQGFRQALRSPGIIVAAPRQCLELDERGGVVLGDHVQP